MHLVRLNRLGLSGRRLYDPDALAYADAVSSYGEVVGSDWIGLVSNFIRAEKGEGPWWASDDYLCFWGPSPIASLTSLKQRRLATAFNSPAFLQYRGYTFNATTNYIDTGFVPGTHAVTMGVSSVHLESYERTNVFGNTSPIGATSAGAQINVFPRSSGNVAVLSVMGGIANYSGATDSRGLTQSGRNGAALTSHYAARNGVDYAKTADYSSLGASLPTTSFFVGGCNVNGSYSQGRATSVGYVAWGAALNATQRLARYNNVQAWATAVGAQV